MTRSLTHNGRPARYRVRYADGDPIPGRDADSLFDTFESAVGFAVSESHCNPEPGIGLSIFQIDDDGSETEVA